jgi:hypothetical protein
MMIRHHDTAHSRDRRWHRPLIGLSPWKASANALASLAWIYDWGNRAAWAAAAVTALLFFYAVGYAIPNARFTAAQQERDVIEHESRAFCEKHGMAFGSREHTLCAVGLTDIRANERQRTLADSGIF